MAIAGLNERFEEMHSYNALIGFRDEEMPIVDEKLRFLFDQMDPTKQEERFDRVVELAGLPDPETVEGAVDVEKLLQVRNTDECRQFRQWLRSLDSASDEEIEAEIGSLREKLSRAVRSRSGKTVRFIATTGAGFIPIVGPAIGPALGALDTFAVEKLLPEPGPVSFLGSSYSSIFKDESGAARGDRIQIAPPAPDSNSRAAQSPGRT